jgi:hypothetical protein
VAVKAGRHLSFCHVSLPTFRTTPTRLSGAACASITTVPPQMQTRRLALHLANPRLKPTQIQGRNQVPFRRHMESLPDRTTAAGTLLPATMQLGSSWGSLIGALDTLSLVNLIRSSCPTACDGARRPACTTVQIFFSRRELHLVDTPSTCTCFSPAASDIHLVT